MNTPDLFESYIKSGLYLRGWSPKTATIYRRAFDSFQRTLPEVAFTKPNLESWIMARRAAGMSAAGINIYIRAMNSFSAWLKEEGHCPEQVVLKQLKAPQKPVTVFSESDIKLIVAFRPATFNDLRLCALVQCLLDTGCRINEVLGLLQEAVDLENLLITVDGKGNKKRKVPISPEFRKTLWKYVEKKSRRGVPGSYVLCSHSGSKLMHRNVYRDIIKLCLKVGINKRVHPHRTPHTFACHFMKNGGSIYSLSRILGHTSVSTTQLYIRGLGIEDFREEHARLSPLARRA
jgi:integrase/recombinase XerD